MANDSFRPSRSLETALLRSMLFVFVVLASVWFAPTAPSQAQERAVLRGIVTLDSPVAAGTIFIFKGPSLLQTEPSGPFANGTFEIYLNPQVAALLPNNDLRVLVEVQESDAPPGSSSLLTLSAVLHDFDPDSQVAFINPVTTVVCAYLDDNPDLTWDDAASKIAGVLGVSTSTTFQSTHMLDFDSAAFIAASAAHGGFDPYVHAVARLADMEGTLNYAKGPAPIQATASDDLGSAQIAGTTAVAATAPNFLKLITGVGKGIVKDAFKTDVGAELGGWILDTILGGLTPAKEDKLDQISKQLDQISTQISDLGKQITKQIADLTEAIKTAQNYIVYQQVALATNPAIVSLDGMRQRLYFLALAGAAGEAHPDLAADLSRDIFSKAKDDLVTIQNGLAGVNQTPGLITQWAKVMLDADPNLGFPVLFTNDYLTSATAQYQFYLGAQFEGFTLRIEYAHTIIKNSPVLAKQIINDAIESFESNFNTDLKLVAANAHASIGGRNYYPSIVLPANNLIADSRSGFVWLRTEACAPSKTPPCYFAVNQNIPGTTGYPLAGEFLRNFSVGGVEHFSLPSKDNWTNLLNRLSEASPPWETLDKYGFELDGQKDSVFPPVPPGYVLSPLQREFVSYWTSDAVSLPTGVSNWYFDLGDYLGCHACPRSHQSILVTDPKLIFMFKSLPKNVARVLPRVLNLDLLYAEDPHVLRSPASLAASM